MKKRRIVAAVTVVALGLLAFALFVPGLTAQAAALEQTPAPQKTPGPWRATLIPVRQTLQALSTQEPLDLEKLLSREKLTLTNQQVRLELAHTIADNTLDYIESEKSAGKDTAALESALKAFEQDIKYAEAASAEAGRLLAAPAGFDSGGNVVDREEARRTLRAAGHQLREAHRGLSSGTRELNRAVRAYRGK